MVDKGCSLRRSDLPAANRDARPLAPQGEEAAKGLRLRSLGLLSYFSRQAAGLPVVDLAKFDLPSASRRHSLTPS